MYSRQTHDDNTFVGLRIALSRQETAAFVLERREAFSFSFTRKPIRCRPFASGLLHVCYSKLSQSVCVRTEKGRSARKISTETSKHIEPDLLETG